jgi:GrpB-like predicted nucleotidyltransferase (UPF0157 family)
MRRDPIVIVEYDDAWPSMFEVERARLVAVFAPALVRPIEHIGSTAVPGLAAKPIIDMLAVVDDIEVPDQADAHLVAVHREFADVDAPGGRHRP